MQIKRKLKKRNYNQWEIKQIITKLSHQNIKKLLQMNYINLHNYFLINNIDVSKINEYNEYQKQKNISLKKAVTMVNLNLNKPFYTDIKKITNPKKTTILVNKYNYLSSNYIPKKLVNIKNTNIKIQKKVNTKLKKLLKKAQKENIILIPFSAYRSYEYQKKLYENYLKKEKQEIVDTYSARPGHSEHQTGLALDIRSKNLTDRLTPKDYKWLTKNAYKYGFIIRYPKNKTTITGYKEEPWHLRYIGKKHATKIHQLNITFDEYYDQYLKQY